MRPRTTLARTIHDPPAPTPYAPTIAALNDSGRAHRTEEVRRRRAAEVVRLALAGAYGVSRRCFMNNPGLSLALSALLAPGWVGIGCAPELPAPERLPPLVITHEVAPPSPTIERRFSGVTSAADSAELGFEVGGRIIEVEAIRGRRYDKGAALARLDVSTYQTDLARAQAEATRTEQDLKRVQQLFERGSSSKAQLDSAIAAQRSTAAALKNAVKRVGDGVLTMPYPGFVSEVLRERQEVVSAGTPVVRIQGEGDMEMEIGVPGDVVNSIDLGHPARVRIGRALDKEFAAKVLKVATQASEDTTYAITLSLVTEDDAVRVGLDGEATLELPNPSGATISIPAVCLVGAPDGKRFVWWLETLEDGTGRAVRRSVETGNLRPEGFVEIRTGLRGGDRIISRGVHRIEDGLRVRYE